MQECLEASIRFHVGIHAPSVCSHELQRDKCIDCRLDHRNETIELKLLKYVNRQAIWIHSEATKLNHERAFDMYGYVLIPLEAAR